MRCEKEFCLIVKLLDSPFVKGGIFKKQRTACKKDFERFLGISENNKEFRSWIDSLIDSGAIECFGKESKGVGNEVDVFVINFKRMEEVLRNNDNFDPNRRYFERGKVF